MILLTWPRDGVLRSRWGIYGKGYDVGDVVGIDLETGDGLPEYERV